MRKMLKFCVQFMCVYCYDIKIKDDFPYSKKATEVPDFLKMLHADPQLWVKLCTLRLLYLE